MLKVRQVEWKGGNLWQVGESVAVQVASSDVKKVDEDECMKCCLVSESSWTSVIRR